MLKAGESSLENVSFIFTNVPGPNSSNLTILNKKVIDILPFVPHSKLPFSIVAFSFGGIVRFSLHADKIRGPDVEQIGKLLEKEIEAYVPK